MLNIKIHSNRGVILVDVLMALMLGTLFVALIGEATFSGRSAFAVASERSRLLDIYISHESEFDSLSSYENKVLALGGGDVITASARPYGNDMIEIVTSITSENGHGEDSDSLKFTKIRKHPSYDITKPSSIPSCSVDFSSGAIVGSFEYFDNHPEDQSVNLSDRISLDKIILPIPMGIPLTDFEVRGNHLYLSSDSDTASDIDFMVFDISSTTAAKMIASINTGPGIAAFSIGGNRVYAALTSTAFQLNDIRMDALNSAAPNLVLENRFKLLLPYATATPTVGSSIFYSNDRIYLGTEKWDGEELSIFDVSNTPNIVKVGGYEIGSKLNDIYIRDNLAYIASASQKQLELIDITNPTNVIPTSAFSPFGWQRQEGKVVSYFEHALSFGRTSGGFDISTDHEMFSWATTSPALDSVSPSSLNFPGGIYGIITDRSNVFMITRRLDQEFQILNRSMSTTSAQIISLPESPLALSCDRSGLYVLSQDSSTVYKITFK